MKSSGTSDYLVDCVVKEIESKIVAHDSARVELSEQEEFGAVRYASAYIDGLKDALEVIKYVFG